MTFLSFLILKISPAYFKKLTFLSFYILFLSKTSYLSLSSPLLLIKTGSTLIDEYSFILNLMLIMVLYFRYLCFKVKIKANLNSDYLGLILFIVLLISSVLVFYMDRAFWVYFGYEMSLIPIIIIIIIWGSYPERLYGSIMILLYTLFFTFPLMGVLCFYYIQNSNFSLFYRSDVSFRSTIMIILFLSFAVKLPVFGLHYWLPLAHVEAPTFGSILLAGILLKLGGCGIYRFLMTFSSFSPYFSSIFLWILLFGMLISSLVCCVQTDIKRLVAYSSVVHITSMGLVLVLIIYLGNKSALIIIFSHGLVSPLLFYLVGELYDSLGTRSILIIRGLYFISPLIFWVMVMSFFLRVPVPPSLPFLGEVMFFISLLYLRSSTYLLFFVYIFLAVLFNLFWLRTRFGSYRNLRVLNVTIGSIYIMLRISLLRFLVLILAWIF